MADEIGRCAAIEQNGRPRVSFEFDVAERPGHFVTRGRESGPQFCCFSSRNLHLLGQWQVPIIAYLNGVLASVKPNRLAAVSDRLVVYEHIGLFWEHANFQNSTFCLALRQANSRSDQHG